MLSGLRSPTLWGRKGVWLLLAILVGSAAPQAAGQAQLQADTVVVGSLPVTVSLRRTFVSPVVVCTVNYNNNVVPLVPRVSNVTATSFDVRLQNPSGAPMVSESVHYLVVEEGVWTVDGMTIEAQAYLSTVTDDNGSWVGQVQAYGQVYANPVVLGQVMTENDARWSVFWCRGVSAGDPPSTAWLRTGKTVCEDGVIVRANETVGFVVIQAGHGLVGGVEFEARLGSDTVEGIGNTPPDPYGFSPAFGSAPAIAVASVAGMDGNNGGWAVLYGPTPTLPTVLNLSVDEDQIADAERVHTTEQVGYLVLAQRLLYPNQAPDDPAGLTLSECPQASGTDKTPSLQWTQADDDGDPVSYRIQVDDTDNTFGSLVIDYTSAAAAPGARTFTVGQAAGGGAYSVGWVGQALATGTYYWRVQSTDGFATSAWVEGASFDIREPTIDFSSGTYNAGEAGGACTITVDLSEDSCQTITVNYASADGTAAAPADYGAVAGVLTFNPGETSQSFTVTPVNDGVDEADETVILTLSGPSQAPLAGVNNPAVLTVTDDDTAEVAVTESGGATAVVEGGPADTYTLVLTSEPTANVTITVTPDAETDLGSGAGVAIALTFTALDWGTPQTVTVNAVDDDVDVGARSSTITHSVASADANYNGLVLGNVVAGITEDDFAGVVLVESDGFTEVVEGGATDSYSILLSSEPLMDVIITALPDTETDFGAGGGVPTTVTLTSANWSLGQSLTITAVDDAIAEGIHTSTITHSVLSGDGKYNGLAAPSIGATIIDDDGVGGGSSGTGGTDPPDPGEAEDPETPGDDTPEPPPDDDADPPPPPDDDPPGTAFDIRVRIEVGKPFAWVGEELLFIVTVANVGDGTADDVVLRMRVSRNGELVLAKLLEANAASTISMGTAWPGGEMAIAIGDVTPGQTVRMEITVRGINAGTLILEAGIANEAGPLCDVTAQLIIEDRYERIVITRRPAGLCGVSVLDFSLVLAGLMALKGITAMGLGNARCPRWRG